MASKIEQAKNTLKKLKEKKTALDKQIAVAEKVLTNEKKIAEIAVKAAKAGATAKKVAGKAFRFLCTALPFFASNKLWQRSASCRGRSLFNGSIGQGQDRLLCTG